MSKPNPAPEPTMEEILASIRRIISDGDEMAGSAPLPPPPPPPPAQRSAPPPPMPVRPAAVPEPVAEDTADAAAEDADIFDLTDAMVAKPETVAPDFDFDSIDVGAEEDVAAVAAEPLARPAPAPRPEPAAARLVEPELVQFGADEEPARPMPGSRAPQAERLVEASAPPRPAPAPMPSGQSPELDGRGTFAPSPSRATDRPAEPAAETPSSLMSPQTDSAVAAAFGRLANTILSRDPKTLEDLVKEMLRPMLKEWLDDNLPVLVERLVREEIERVSRGRR